MNWTDIPVTPTATPTIPAQPNLNTPSVMIEALLAAAKVFDSRRDSFATGKGDICRDMAAKLRRFGSFASEKQAGFAAKLVEWSKPRQGAAPAAPAGIPVPDLFAVMQKHADLYADDMKIARRNQDSLCWITWHNVVAGKIENGVAILFYARLRQTLDSDGSKLEALLREFEANPLEAARKYGRLSGRCCSCGRDLTNEGSIEAGIGPICAQKFS